MTSEFPIWLVVLFGVLFAGGFAAIFFAIVLGNKDKRSRMLNQHDNSSL